MLILVKKKVRGSSQENKLIRKKPDNSMGYSEFTTKYESDLMFVRARTVESLKVTTGGVPGSLGLVIPFATLSLFLAGFLSTAHTLLKRSLK